jgi:fused signal recognition particle receptor
MFRFFDVIKKEDEKLSKSSEKIKKGLASIFTGKKLDKKTIDELEELLITSDIGINIVENIIQFLEKNKFDKEITVNEVKEIIFQKLFGVFKNISSNFIDFDKKPYVLMFLGVNGSGKTTIIGKIAKKLKNEGKKVLLSACDTFRAGATEQLNEWAKKVGVDMVRAERENEDPSSVAYKSLLKAQKEDYDVLLIDTAGRFYNNQNLMAELEKMDRVLKKIDANTPDKNILVLDATIGQNSIKQLEVFDKSINVDGLIINKMDGTSKGGVLVSIVDRFRKPIYAVGVGEKIDDIKNFDAKEFLDELLGIFTI